MHLSDLTKPFPGNAISWRAQSVTKQEPYKAMALAYIDARDVMARLDEVCGPENWQDSYAETPSGRVICTISIRVGDDWVSKADGSGDSDIEGEKGGISGAFKRAAVKWGIGRYLYDMPTPWVECEVYNGKWKKWTANGLRELARVGGGSEPSKPAPVVELKGELLESEQAALRKLNEVKDNARLALWFEDNKPIIDSAEEASKAVLRAAYSGKLKQYPNPKPRANGVDVTSQPLN